MGSLTEGWRENWILSGTENLDGLLEDSQELEEELTNVDDETKGKSMGPKVWLNRHGPTHGLYTHTVLYSLSLS